MMGQWRIAVIATSNGEMRPARVKIVFLEMPEGQKTHELQTQWEAMGKVVYFVAN